MKQKSIIIFFAFTSMLFWSFSFIGSKIAFKYYDPISVILLRMILSSAFLFLILLVFYPKALKNPRKELPKFILLAFFEPFLYFMGESYGLLLLDATIAAVIISSIPIFTSIVGFLFFNEQLSKINFLGIFVSFIGIVLMLVDENMKIDVPIEGLLLVFLAVAATVGYVFSLKKVSHDFHPIYVIAMQNLFGVLFFAPLFFVFSFSTFIQIRPNLELITTILLLSIFASSLAFILFTIVTRAIGVSKTNVFTNLIPVFTAIASYFILDERFSMLKLGGILVVLFGLFLSQKPIKNSVSV